ncbi:MAG: hypothetical protein WCI02_05730 [Planctomycetota bacterium]
MSSSNNDNDLSPNPYSAPSANPASPLNQSAEPRGEGDATGGVIPYKNPSALIAYYLGILSGLPLIGLPLGIAAFVLGIMGLKARKKDPAIKGSVHAAIGIGCGGFFTVLWTLVVVGILFAVMNAKGR